VFHVSELGGIDLTPTMYLPVRELHENETEKGRTPRRNAMLRFSLSMWRIRAVLAVFFAFGLILASSQFAFASVPIRLLLFHQWREDLNLTQL